MFLQNRFLLFSVLLHSILILAISMHWREKPFSLASASLHDHPIYARLTALPSVTLSKPSPPPLPHHAEIPVHPSVASSPHKSSKKAVLLHHHHAIKASPPPPPMKQQAKTHPVLLQKKKKQIIKKTVAPSLKNNSKLVLHKKQPPLEAKKIPHQPIEKQRPKKSEEDLMQAQLAQEQAQFAAAHRAQLNAQLAREMSRYKRQLVAAIGRHWLIPKGVDPTRVCQLFIQVAPGGKVLNVQLIASSGNAALDRSVLAAVHKASPLPVPADPQLFQKFSQLRLTVRPEEVI